MPGIMGEPAWIGPRWHRERSRGCGYHNLMDCIRGSASSAAGSWTTWSSPWFVGIGRTSVQGLLSRRLISTEQSHTSVYQISWSNVYFQIHWINLVNCMNIHILFWAMSTNYKDLRRPISKLLSILSKSSTGKFRDNMLLSYKKINVCYCYSSCQCCYFNYRGAGNCFTHIHPVHPKCR